MIEPPKFQLTYSSLGKALEKQAKAIENQSKKQIKAIEDHGNNWLDLMSLLRRILILTEIVYHMKNKKNI